MARKEAMAASTTKAVHAGDVVSPQEMRSLRSSVPWKARLSVLVWLPFTLAASALAHSWRPGPRSVDGTTCVLDAESLLFRPIDKSTISSPHKSFPL